MQNMTSPLLPVGVGAEGALLVGSGIGYTGSQHSLSGNSLAIVYRDRTMTASRATRDMLMFFRTYYDVISIDVFSMLFRRTIYYIRV